MRLIFLGPPGAGKGTQASILADIAQVPHISTGDILRQAIADATPLGQKAKDYMDRGDLVPDPLILDLIRDRLSQSDTQKGWILDGFPRNVKQAEFLDQLLAEIHQSANYVVNLEVSDEILVVRLLGRGRTDDNEETIRRRLEVYHGQTAPVITYYQNKGTLHNIPGEDEMAEVTQRLKTLIQG